MKNVISRNKIKDPYCRALAYYLNSALNKPRLIEVISSTLTVTPYFNRTAAYCIGLVLPFHITLPLYIYSYIEEQQIIEEALNKQLITRRDVRSTSLQQWVSYYHYVNEIKISNRYAYLISNPSMVNLEEYQQSLKIPDSSLSANSYLNQVTELINNWRGDEYGEEVLTTIRRNDQVRAIYYVVTYLGCSADTAQQIINYSQLCLTLQLNQQASFQQRFLLQKQ